ncbi:sensor histidine kinase [Paenibacillus thermoaerophilus]|uniref:histidine kinase n=1 Tax=Paenibacillus thermoaerophilus TaxID=1215385 RepID=A0ABW2V9N5_9BACL|nr:histidine kinase [Paenibacillus thermoaerophilus]TMV05480.1 HAMP domain-containing protein [Paenibacillus thermoaerophilus]
MKIKTKLILSYILLVVLLNSIAFFLFHSSQNEKKGYENILSNFFLLNDIYSTTVNVNQSLNAYLVSKSVKSMDDYRKHVATLMDKSERLSEIYEQKRNFLTSENYRNMIQTFVRESDAAINQYSTFHYDLYYSHLKEAQKVSNFIQQMTLHLINKELTNYNDYYARINEKHRYTTYMSVSIFMTTLLSGIVFAVRFSSGITRPIIQLRDAAKEISRGNFKGRDVVVRTNDEFIFLASTFNQMRNNIADLIEEIRRKSEIERLVNQMELKSLQNQMNPHFFFNTLNIVARMADVEGAGRTSELVEAVSSLLRYNLTAMDRTTTIRDEVDIIKDYLHIQNTRFGNRLTTTMEIDERCLPTVIPPLIIQPIVENAFIHGIEGYEDGARLHIAISRREEHIVIEIRDNGVGMDEATRQKLLNPAIAESESSELPGAKKASNGVGVRNVVRRLQLYYQRERVIEIESEPNRGTTVRLLIPA